MKQIPLTQGKFTVVDDDIYEKYGHLNWYARKHRNTFYAQRKSSIKDDPNGKQHIIQLHRIIMNCPENLEIDHIDGNGLNNQRSNLRISTNRENSQNKFRHRNGRLVGACLEERKYKNKIYVYWRSRIYINGKHKNLGTFKTEQEAHEVYLKALEEYQNG